MSVAISKAGTAAFLSSNKHAFTSRTAGFIVQQEFPPGIENRPPGPLVGVNFSSLPFTDINRFKGTGYDPTPGPNGERFSGTNGAPIPLLGLPGALAGFPGGVPLYKNGILIGGVGVSGDNGEMVQVQQVPDLSEDVALAGQIGYQPREALFGSHVFIDGIAVAYVNSTTSLGVVQPLGTIGAIVGTFPLIASPQVSYPTDILNGVPGELRRSTSGTDPDQIRGDPLPGLINGVARLSAAEVRSILGLAARRARTTRAGIRLPRGQAAEVFIAVVNNPNQDGVAPAVLGVFRTTDATIFSWDVAVQKARTAIFFSGTNFAMSSRAVGFLSQASYPPGIEKTDPGLFFSLQERFSNYVGTNPLNGATIPSAFPVNPNLPNGITIFPGGFPLYRDGQLIGAIGISGDGVDQDDIIGASGTEDFLAEPDQRADGFIYRDARLPYAKFPRNPAL
jgi:uncharacterized protein GlcG (DUF336 family)